MDLPKLPKGKRQPKRGRKSALSQSERHEQRMVGIARCKIMGWPATDENILKAAAKPHLESTAGQALERAGFDRELWALMTEIADTYARWWRALGINPHPQNTSIVTMKEPVELPEGEVGRKSPLTEEQRDAMEEAARRAMGRIDADLRIYAGSSAGMIKSVIVFGHTAPADFVTAFKRYAIQIERARDARNRTRI
jgi:hypothetical protein